MSFDTIIRGGTVATAADTFACDVAIRDGRVVALGHDLGEAATIIDATDRLVLPGGIDSHVHFAQPSGDGIVMADGFAAAMRQQASRRSPASTSRWRARPAGIAKSPCAQH